MTEKMYDIVLNLFEKEISISTVKWNLKSFSGRDKGYFEFRLTIFADSRYEAVKKAREILANSAWVKAQDLTSHRKG